jgi:serine/threonine protein phosphatase PrpC
LETPNKQH